MTIGSRPFMHAVNNKMRVKGVENLVNTFNEIRSCYFPRWDIKNEWKVKFFDILIFSGYCDIPNKTISVNSRKWENSIVRGHYTGLYVLLIHEIAHAVTRTRKSNAHGDKFQNRLRKVADKARDIGKIDPANELEADIQDCKKSPKSCRKE